MASSGRQNKLKVSIRARKGSRVEQVIVELDFVQSVPKKLYCVLCQDLLRVPCLVTCCKASYCRDCIDRLSITTGKCSIKKCQKNYAIITNGPLVEEIKKKIQSIKVYCFKKASGCKWTGTIDQLENSHYNLGKYDERDTNACQFQEVSCPNNCGTVLPRGKIKDHRFSECEKESCLCEYCGKHFQSRRTQREHQKVCLSIPVECPNGCKLSGISRAEIERHVYEECSLRLVSCDYRHVGCDAELRFIDLAKHNMESYQKHLDLMSSQLEFIGNENEELRNENSELRDENKKLYSEINRLALMLKECGQDVEIDYVAMDSALVERANFHLEGSENGYVSCCTSHLDNKSLNTAMEDEYIEPISHGQNASYQNSTFHADRKSLNILFEQKSVASIRQESPASQEYLEAMETAAGNQIYEDPDKVRAKRQKPTIAEDKADEDDDGDEDKYDDVVSWPRSSIDEAPELPIKPQNLKRTRSKLSKASMDSQGDEERSNPPSRLSRSSTETNQSSLELSQTLTQEASKHKHSSSDIPCDVTAVEKCCDAKEGILIPGLLNSETHCDEQTTASSVTQQNEAAGNSSSNVKARNPHWGSLLDLMIPSSQEKTDEDGYQIIKPRFPREKKKSKENKPKPTQEEPPSAYREVRSTTYTISIPSSRSSAAQGNSSSPLKVPMINPKFAEAVRNSPSPINLPQLDALGAPDLPPRSYISKPDNDANLATPNAQGKPDSPDCSPQKPVKPAKQVNPATSPPKPALPVKPNKLSTPNVQPPRTATEIKNLVGPKPIPLDPPSLQPPAIGTENPTSSSLPHGSQSGTKNEENSPSDLSHDGSNGSTDSSPPSQPIAKTTAKSELGASRKLSATLSVGLPPPTAPRPDSRPRLSSSTPNWPRPTTTAGGTTSPLSRPRLNTATPRSSETLPLPVYTSQPNFLKRQSLPPVDQPLNKVQLIAKHLEQQKLPIVMNPQQS